MDDVRQAEDWLRLLPGIEGVVAKRPVVPRSHARPDALALLLRHHSMSTSAHVRRLSVSMSVSVTTVSRGRIKVRYIAR